MKQDQRTLGSGAILVEFIDIAPYHREFIFKT